MHGPVLKHPAVRDLAWACFAPPLLLAPRLETGQRLANAAFPLTGPRARWLAALDAEPGPLLAHLEARPATRLGLYFEALWHYFLEAEPSVQLVAHNLAVRDRGRTLGEFDCLYYCHHRRRHVHLELAVKYYLGWPAETGDDESSWLGPNSNDRLDRKVERLLNHQSRLAQGDSARTVLAGHGITGELLTEIEVKGQLFRHPAHPIVAPPGYNPDVALQRWCRLAELERHLAAGEQYRLLPRLRWLAPARAGDGELLDARQLGASLRRHFGEHSRPVLVACIGHDGREQRRLFVTDADWPLK